MLLERVGLREEIVANVALERTKACVGLHVPLDLLLLVKATIRTLAPDPLALVL